MRHTVSKMSKISQTVDLSIDNTELEPLVFDYFNFYRHYQLSNGQFTPTIAKYFLPILITKIYVTLTLASLMQTAPFAYFILISLFELLFLIFLLVVRPFESTFTNFRLVAISTGILGGNVVMCFYLYFSQLDDYRMQL